MNVLVFQRIAIEFLIDIVRFPIWWYTGGLFRVGKGMWNMLREANMTLAPGLWLKNIFVPMFGQTDWQGRLTSIFMRTVNIIGRGIALIFVTILYAGIFLMWVFFPLFVLYMLSISLFG